MIFVRVISDLDYADVQHKIKKCCLLHCLQFDSRIKGILRWLVKKVFMHVLCLLPGIQFILRCRSRVLLFDVVFHADERNNKKANKLKRLFLVLHFITQNTQEICRGFFYFLIASPNHRGIYFLVFGLCGVLIFKVKELVSLSSALACY